MKITTLIIFTLYYTFFFSQWSSDPSINTPICTETFKQNDPRIISDGKKGAFIAWKDERNGLPDIYVQRLNADGIVLWTANGTNICSDTSDQSTPNLTSDLNGGVIVSWSDRRQDVTNRDVYVQRIDSNGTVLWLANGVGVATKLNREHNEKIVSDGAGGAIIVWEQLGVDWEIWAQRIDFSGNQIWPIGGISICTVPGKKNKSKNTERWKRWSNHYVAR